VAAPARGVLAQRREERPRARRGRDPELCPQPSAQPLAHGERARAVADGGQPGHEIAGGGLVERVERQPAARVVDGGLRGGCGLGQPRQHRRQPVRVLVARLEHPALVQVGQQRAGAQGDRLLERARRDPLLERRDVGLAPQPDAVAAADERSLGAGPERLAQRPGRAAQRRPRGGVEHLGPEHRGDRAAGMLAGVQRQPRQQAPRAAARRRGHLAPVDLDRQRAEEADGDHADPNLPQPTDHVGLTVR
jgi:hypothetical protein